MPDIKTLVALDENTLNGMTYLTDVVKFGTGHSDDDALGDVRFIVETRSGSAMGAPADDRIDIRIQWTLDDENHEISTSLGTAVEDGAVHLDWNTEKSHSAANDLVKSHDVVARFVEPLLGDMLKHMVMSRRSRIAEMARELQTPHLSLSKHRDMQAIKRDKLKKLLADIPEKYRNAVLNRKPWVLSKDGIGLYLVDQEKQHFSVHVADPSKDGPNWCTYDDGKLVVDANGTLISGRYPDRHRTGRPLDVDRLKQKIAVAVGEFAEARPNAPTELEAHRTASAMNTVQKRIDAIRDHVEDREAQLAAVLAEYASLKERMGERWDSLGVEPIPGLDVDAPSASPSTSL